MAVIVDQVWEGPQWGTESGQLRYCISGTEDKLAALAYLRAAAPPIDAGQVLQSCEVQQVDGTLDEWTGTAKYAVRDRKEPQTNEFTFSFDTSGGTVHLTNSIRTMGKYTPDGPDPDNKDDLSGAIGWDGEQVQGVDVTRPAFQFERTHYLPTATVTNGYVRTLAVLTGCYNQQQFGVYAPGECLFLGASGRKRGSDDWEISFKFASAPNAVLTVGPITGIVKRGWDYFWVKYEEHTNDDGTKVIPKPIAVYVEEVYYPGNFSLLGIG